MNAIRTPQLNDPVLFRQDFRTTMAATVVFVHDDNLVNLTVFRHDGQPLGLIHIPFRQPDEEAPQGYFAEYSPEHSSTLLALAQLDQSVTAVTDTAEKVTEHLGDQTYGSELLSLDPVPPVGAPVFGTDEYPHPTDSQDSAEQSQSTPVAVTGDLTTDSLSSDTVDVLPTTVVDDEIAAGMQQDYQHEAVVTPTPVLESDYSALVQESATEPAVVDNSPVDEQLVASVREVYEHPAPKTEAVVAPNPDDGVPVTDQTR